MAVLIFVAVFNHRGCIYNLWLYLELWLYLIMVAVLVIAAVIGNCGCVEIMVAVFGNSGCIGNGGCI